MKSTKNINRAVFCFDGTCNDPADAGDYFSDTSISNVLKLHALTGGTRSNAIKCKKKTLANQHSFYYKGIGTYGGWFRQKINSAIAPRGMDMKNIIASAESDLARLNKNTDIYIFGFSRGAAIARMFAAKHTGNRKIRFLGVFDTVAAVRKSLDLNPDTLPASGILFENGSIGGHIEEAVHLVAIDEKRIAFQPTLINSDKRVTEVWFAGVHSDVGGGYWFDGLSDIALEFMCARAERAGLTVLAADEVNYKELNINNVEPEDRICRDDIDIAPLPTGKLHEQHRAMGMAEQTLSPRLVRINQNDMPLDSEASCDNAPIIHHSVCERFRQVTEYRPYALRNQRFRVMNADGVVSKQTYHGISGLRHYL